MWVLFACGSALFAGLTAILAKLGIRQTDSDVATAIRTIVVLAFSWLMVAVVGSFDQIAAVSPRTLLFLVLSGLATGSATSERSRWATSTRSCPSTSPRSSSR